mmetsp:Transcript_1520/g.4854  ORF Transcript_1520/g.4854 Transcript_1520/m.4854 type:complete len:314 (+) Transcript_1520:1641-2582(+)
MGARAHHHRRLPLPRAPARCRRVPPPRYWWGGVRRWTVPVAVAVPGRLCAAAAPGGGTGRGGVGRGGGGAPTAAAVARTRSGDDAVCAGHKVGGRGRSCRAAPAAAPAYRRAHRGGRQLQPRAACGQAAAGRVGGSADRDTDGGGGRVYVRPHPRHRHLSRRLHPQPAAARARSPRPGLPAPRRSHTRQSSRRGQQHSRFGRESATPRRRAAGVRAVRAVGARRRTRTSGGSRPFPRACGAETDASAAGVGACGASRLVVAPALGGRLPQLAHVRHGRGPAALHRTLPHGGAACAGDASGSGLVRGRGLPGRR